MITRTLGHDGPAVSVLGMGCWGMSHAYGHADESESIAAVGSALEHGINHFDTAGVYGAGHNERLLRRALLGQPQRAVIATKFGFVGDEHGRLRVDGRPEHVRAACDGSLRRLGVEVIDLYFLHRVDKNTPIEETVGAMADLVHAGKVLFLGLCETSARTLRRAHSVHPIAALQSEYSLWSRDVERKVLPACRELGIVLMAFSPLGRGFFTGAVRSCKVLAPGDYRRSLPRFSEEHLDANLAIVVRLEALAAARGATPAQIALAWLLARGPDVVPIPGMSRRTHIVENIGAVSIALTTSELAELDALSSLTSGSRHNPFNMQFVET